MKSFLHKHKLVIYGLFAVTLAFTVPYSVLSYIPVKKPSQYAEIATSINSPEFNSKLIEYYSDGKITIYENYRLEQLASEIKEEQFLSN
ncbi:hypothetical protein ACPV5G_20910, partial [Photobacterium damselae]|uniref:hypothetical protein n=1 Tax=Photobacterium damselae TaxID=38293 RepID=UPI004068E853